MACSKLMDDSKLKSLDDSLEAIKDIDEDTPVRWNFEMAQKYILAKIGTYIQDPAHNPLIAMKENITAVSEEMRELCDKYVKLNKSVEHMGREQLLFLTRIGAEPRIISKDVGVGVDLPPLPETERFSYNFNATAKAKGIAKPFIKKTPGEPVECIDLTEEESSASVKSNEKEQVLASGPTASTAPQKATTPSNLNQPKHPAPLPSLHLLGQNASTIPPKPAIKISIAKNGIVLQWDMPPEAKTMNITNFEIYGYQEKNNVSASSTQWERIGYVHAMPLPMSCTLTQFVQGCKYHFSIRAITGNNKLGHFSDPASIIFVADANKK